MASTARKQTNEQKGKLLSIMMTGTPAGARGEGAGVPGGGDADTTSPAAALRYPRRRNASNGSEEGGRGAGEGVRATEMGGEGQASAPARNMGVRVIAKGRPPPAPRPPPGARTTGHDGRP